jgi:hypothetical protein
MDYDGELDLVRVAIAPVPPCQHVDHDDTLTAPRQVDVEVVSSPQRI